MDARDIEEAVLEFCKDRAEPGRIGGEPHQYRRDLWAIFEKAYDAGLCRGSAPRNVVSGDSIRALARESGWVTGNEISSDKYDTLQYVARAWDHWTFALENRSASSRRGERTTA